MRIVSIPDAQANLSALIEQVLQEREVIIGEPGKPMAKLVPFAVDTHPRELGIGSWKGKIWIADDFDDQPVDGMQ